MESVNIVEKLRKGQRFWVMSGEPAEQFVDTVIGAGYYIKCVGAGADVRWYEIMSGPGED